jgi:predicted phage baseplate assembly protein
VTIKKVEPFGERCTLVQLENDLANEYDRASAVVYGNVVPAIQGQTIRNEYLGESDGTKPNQHFTLSSPLAYVPAEADDYRTSLSVLVNKIQWNQVPSLLDQPAGGRVYMVRRNGLGQTVITFGDGEQGARLPTSREILTATYRSGGGAAGNVAPNSLTMLQSHLPYIKAVTNPGPAQGGLPPESAGHGRDQAPRRVRALDRIVTLKDYGDYASTFAGVSQAAARVKPENAPRWIDIAIVPRQNLPLDPTQPDPLLTMLEREIYKSRSSAAMPFKLRRIQPVTFFLAMQLYVSPEMREDKDRIRDLIRAVRQKILEKYSREMQILGSAVTEADLFQLAQSVHGITAVMLTRFQKDPPPPTREESDSGFMLATRWDELLVTDEDQLKVEVA